MDANIENVTNTFVVNAEKFSVYDYVLFLLMLLVSALIGVYFGCFGKKQHGADEYLLGGRSMGVFPIAMSLIASFTSGITILAVPADVYNYGSMYWLCGVAICLVNLVSVYVFIPIFFKLQLKSTYGYLELRYNEHVRKMCSFLYAVQMFLYLPIVIYVPSLALAQGTGFNVHQITPVLCGVCIFYTTIGGLKAVVWTDTLQFVIMIGSIMAIVVLGTVASGGVFNIYETSVKGERLQINFNADVTERDTFWSFTVGLFFVWLKTIPLGQSAVQKCIAMPTMAHVKKAFVIFSIGMFLITACSVYIGLMIYTKYSNCDPVKSKVATKYDQLLPLFMLDVSKYAPGLAGLFIAGVFSASLSSLSAYLNSVACTIYEDFLAGYMPEDLAEKKVGLVLKSIVVVIGVVCTLLVYIIEHLGGMLEVSLSIAGVISGPEMGIFLLGMFFKKANSKGALTGAAGSVVIMAWIIFGSRYYRYQGMIRSPTKPISVHGCNYPFNNTLTDTITPDPNLEPWFFYKISHYYYAMIGCILAILIGLPISWATNDGSPVDKNLLAPIVHGFIKDKQKIGVEAAGAIPNSPELVTLLARKAPG